MPLGASYDNSVRLASAYKWRIIN